MPSSYLAKAVAAASRTTSPVTAPRIPGRLFVPKVAPSFGSLPAVNLSPQSFDRPESGLSQSYREQPIQTQRISYQSSPPVEEKQIEAKASAQTRNPADAFEQSAQSASAAISAEPQTTPQPAITADPTATAQRAASQAMAGVLQRLSRSVTRVEAPAGLRASFAAAANTSAAQSQIKDTLRYSQTANSEQAIEQQLTAALPSSFMTSIERTPLAVVHSSRDTLAEFALPAPVSNAAASPRVSLSQYSDAQPSDPSTFQAEPGKVAGAQAAMQHQTPRTAFRPQPPVPRSIPSQALPSSSTPVSQSTTAAQASPSQTSDTRPPAQPISQPEVVMAQEPNQHSKLQNALRPAPSTPRPIHSQPVPLPAMPIAQSKPDRRIRIGQLDVQVDNQPSPHIRPERIAASGRAASPTINDLNRFLLRP